MTHGKQNGRFRVHYLLTFDKDKPTERHVKDHADVSVFTPQAAATAVRTSLLGKHGEGTAILIGKVKLMRQVDGLNYGRRRG